MKSQRNKEENQNSKVKPQMAIPNRTRLRPFISPEHV
jgi:hypothetical protein